MTKKLVVTDYNFPDLEIERDVAAAHDIELTGAQARTSEEVIAAAEDADGLIIQYADINEAVLDAVEPAGVGRYGIGVDTIDLEAAADRGIPVMNVPDYCIEEVPTHALALLLACEREVSRYDAAISEGTWDWKVGKPIARVTGSTLGLVGFGKLPRRLVELVDGFDMEILVYDPYVDVEAIEAIGGEKVSFEGLLERSKYVSAHAPLTEETRDLFDAEAFDAMRSDAVLINTARGGLVDVDALQDAIENERIAGAGIDVLPEEPPNPTPPFDHENVVFTPHVAWYSEASISDLRRTVTEDVCAAILGEPIENVVNDP